MHHMKQNNSSPAKDIKTFFHINWQLSTWCDKERKMPDQKDAKAYMKTACSWISYHKNSLEFQFWEKNGFGK